MAQLLGVLEQGLIYAVLALGVYITFKILDFPDMTVDSSFPLGAAVTALMISNGVNPLLTLLLVRKNGGRGSSARRGKRRRCSRYARRRAHRRDPRAISRA